MARICLSFPALLMPCLALLLAAPADAGQPSAPASAAAPGEGAASPVRRGTRSLCVFERGGPAGLVQHAWLEKPGCTRAAAAIVVHSRLPESDIVEMLEQQARLLAGARLLFAGNTQCARQRALAFRLAGIGVGAVVAGGETMAVLHYADDRGGSASVWARRSGLDYSAWNVACPAPRPGAPSGHEKGEPRLPP